MSEEEKHSEIVNIATDLSDIDSKIMYLGELFDQLSSSMKEKIDLAFNCGRNNPLTYSHKVKRVSAPIAA